MHDNRLHLRSRKFRAKLVADLEAITQELDMVPNQAEPQEWPEEQPSSALEAELLKCKLLRQELRRLKRLRH